MKLLLIGGVLFVYWIAIALCTAGATYDDRNEQELWARDYGRRYK